MMLIIDSSLPMKYSNNQTAQVRKGTSLMIICKLIVVVRCMPLRCTTSWLKAILIFLRFMQSCVLISHRYFIRLSLFWKNKHRHSCHRHHFSKFPGFSLTKIAFLWPKKYRSIASRSIQLPKLDGLNPGVSVVRIVWRRPGEGSSEKNWCWWLTFRQPERKLSSESSE